LFLRWRFRLVGFRQIVNPERFQFEVNLIILAQPLDERIAAVAEVAGLQLLGMDLLLPGLPSAVGRLHLFVQCPLLGPHRLAAGSQVGQLPFGLFAEVTALGQGCRGG
jgi:hypothetical protein